MIVVQFSWIFNGLPSPRFLWTKNLLIEENILCLTQNVCWTIILIGKNTWLTIQWRIQDLV